MDITVIIPTYERLDLLKIALKSCVDQTYLPSEIIVVDDSKNDETEKWIIESKFSVKLRYIHNTPNLGQAGNVEKLIQSVQTEYFLLLHDDDLLDENALKLLKEPFISNGDIDVVFGKQFLVNDDIDQIDSDASENLNKGFFRTTNFKGEIKEPLSVVLRQQLPSNSFLMKSVIAKSVHYGEPKKCGNGVDFHFCLKLCLAGCNFYYIDQYVSYYRDSPDGVSKTSDSGYYGFKLIEQLNVKGDYLKNLRKKFLTRLAPIAIIQAKRKSRKLEAWSIYFSQYHFAKIFTLGGIKRFITLLVYKP